MREKGNVLENYVLETWPVEGVSKEPNSGARNNQNDLVTPQHSIECKRKLRQEAVSLSGPEIKCCKNKAATRNKEPAWVIETSIGRFVVLLYDDYCNTLHEKEESGKKEKA